MKAKNNNEKYLLNFNWLLFFGGVQRKKIYNDRRSLIVVKKQNTGKITSIIEYMRRDIFISVL